MSTLLLFLGAFTNPPLLLVVGLRLAANKPRAAFSTEPLTAVRCSGSAFGTYLISHQRIESLNAKPAPVRSSS